MSQQPIKIDENIIVEIKMLQNKFQELNSKMGLLQGEEWELDRMVAEFVEKKKKIKEERSSLQKLDESLMDKIIQKFGEGNLNMEDGTFTSADVQPKTG